MSAGILILGLAMAGGLRVAAAVVLWEQLGLPAVLLAAGVLALVRARRRIRRPSSPDEAAFLGAIAAELRSGSPLVFAIEAASATYGDDVLLAEARRARRGAPASLLFDSLARRLPRNGRLTAFAARLTATDGGAAAPTFERLFMRATRAAESARELRVLTAQSRLSLLVVAGAPITVLAVLALGGGVEDLWRAGTPGRVALVSGISLVAAGIAVSLYWLVRARPER